TCPVRAEMGQQGVTPACNGSPEWEALVVNQDAATFGWNQDVVSLCCGTDGVSGTYAVKTCAPDRGAGGCPSTDFCSACGDSGQKARCKPCYSPNPKYTNGCHLWSESAGCDDVSGDPISFVCHRYCPGGGYTTVTLLGADLVTLECASPWQD